MLRNSVCRGINKIVAHRFAIAHCIRSIPLLLVGCLIGESNLRIKEIKLLIYTKIKLFILLSGCLIGNPSVLKINKTGKPFGKLVITFPINRKIIFLTAIKIVLLIFGSVRNLSPDNLTKVIAYVLIPRTTYNRT